MAGKENTGIAYSDANLYFEKTIILCDIDKEDSYQTNIAKDIFNSLNMKIVYMNSDEHDVHACYVSHMPHIVSFSLANSVLKQEQAENIVSLAGGGFRDVSRIAKSSPFMWVDIFKHNKDNLLKSIQDFEAELQNAKTMIQDENWEEMQKWMEDANKLHNIL